MVPKFLLQVTFLKLHNFIDSQPEEGGIKEAVYEENNILIICSTLHNIISL